MGFLTDIAEIAGLLFVAYLVGWLGGYLAHRLVARARLSVTTVPGQVAAPAAADPPVEVPVATAVGAQLAAAVPADPATDAAGIAPIPAVSALDTLKSLSTTMPLMPPAEPATPPEPVPANAVPTAMESAPPEAPGGTEPDAQVTESPPPVAVSTASTEPAAAAAPAEAPDLAAAAVELPDPAMAAASEPPAAAPASGAAPASAPGVPWNGAINGHAAPKFAPDVAHPREPPPESDTSPADEPEATLDVATDEMKLDSGAGQPPAAPDGSAETPIEPPERSAEQRAETAADAEAKAALEPAPAPPAALDEDAAMRAIEGGWSRRDVRALRDAPELTDVSAAVSAAQMAVEQVLARNGVDASEPDARTQASFGRPPGLSQPRDGRGDDLEQIEGLGPLDEVTLNNLGIYHFDQVAAWDRREVLWLENHAFAVGRIGRENWQGQARELVLRRDRARASR